MTEQEKKAILQKYANIKAQISMLEDQAEDLKVTVSMIVDELNPTDHEVVTDFGKFVNVQKRKYTYSPETVNKEAELKQIKKEEEATGIATYIIQPYLKFDSISVE